jgi:hypothetical protein
VQIVIALVVTPEGLPLAYEVLPGNTADKTTLRGFLEGIERQYGKARRVWLMDRGVPTEEVLAEMRTADPPVYYLVGTPKGRLTRLEKHLIGQRWQQVWTLVRPRPPPPSRRSLEGSRTAQGISAVAWRDSVCAGEKRGRAGLKSNARDRPTKRPRPAPSTASCH